MTDLHARAEAIAADKYQLDHPLFHSLRHDLLAVVRAAITLRSTLPYASLLPLLEALDTYEAALERELGEAE